MKNHIFLVIISIFLHYIVGAEVSARKDVEASPKLIFKDFLFTGKHMHGDYAEYIYSAQKNPNIKELEKDILVLLGLKWKKVQFTDDYQKVFKDSLKIIDPSIMEHILFYSDESSSRVILEVIDRSLESSGKFVIRLIAEEKYLHKMPMKRP